MEPDITIDSLRVALYADGAHEGDIERLAAADHIKGFTTNPTLMRQAGVTHYRDFAERMLGLAAGRPISFEVLADDAETIERQARVIATWGAGIYVKVPVTTTSGEPLSQVIRSLSHDGVQVNVTAVFTIQQVDEVVTALSGGAPSVVSVFAGRIADTGRDPIPHMAAALAVCRSSPGIELLWASPREVLNVVQADAVGCDIITVLPDLLGKLTNLGKDLTQFSRETVAMFHNDAVQSQYEL